MLMPKYAEHEGDGGFGAEFFECDREAYIHTSEGAFEKNKQNLILWKKTVGFQHEIKMSLYTSRVYV